MIHENCPEAECSNKPRESHQLHRELNSYYPTSLSQLYGTWELYDFEVVYGNGSTLTPDELATSAVLTIRDNLVTFSGYVAANGAVEANATVASNISVGHNGIVSYYDYVDNEWDQDTIIMISDSDIYTVSQGTSSSGINFTSTEYYRKIYSASPQCTTDVDYSFLRSGWNQITVGGNTTLQSLQDSIDNDSSYTPKILYVQISGTWYFYDFDRNIGSITNFPENQVAYMLMQ